MVILHFCDESWRLFCKIGLDLCPMLSVFLEVRVTQRALNEDSCQVSFCHLPVIVVSV